MKQWYVLTGGPSSGKSTLLSELQKRGYKTIPEAARIIIDEAIAEGIDVKQLRADEKAFQLAVLNYKREVEKNHPVDITTFFDRGMHDTLAYLRLSGQEIEKKIKAVIQEATYKKVFLLDPLPDYTADYARTENSEQAQRLNQLLYEAFNEYGMQPIRVPSLSPPERADFVLRNIS